MKLRYIFYLVILFVIGKTSVYGQEWYPFNADENFEPSVIDASDWLHIPAGKHGWLEMEGNDYRFADGTPVKFWGVNICDTKAFSEKSVAEEWSRYLVKYGVNGVRFHKFTWDGTAPSPGSTVIDPELFDRFDYFSFVLKEKGIYTGWSHIYGHRVRPEDSTRIVAYDEIVKAGNDHLKGSTIGLVHFAPDLQQLSIDLTVNMLNHHNPYTGMRYADDPSLSFIEIQNEDNAFFATTIGMMEDCPTYKRMICKQFATWLREKYGTQEALKQAWGADAFNTFPECYPDESLDNNNLNPMPNQWFFSNDCLDNMPQWNSRLYDSARFIYECQQAYYDKMVAAVRATGYGGAIVGSCWQAGDNIGHYYNLYSDYQTGVIDRHNYYGGSGGHSLRVGHINNASMLDAPGSGLLGTGMQQVEGRPFAISEWMSLIPNEWTVEASPLIALYGMGLQGWDASYSFANDQPSMTRTVQSPWGGIYNADTPTQRGLYPALFRMLEHGDIKTADVIGECKLYVPEFMNGKLGFRSDVKQQGDQKEFKGVIPPEAMAVGRVTNRFVDSYEETPVQLDYLKYYDASKGEYMSTTKQFVWNTKEKGYFTMTTPCSRAAVGFNSNKTLSLGDIKYTLDKQNPFAVLLVTSLDKGTPLANTSNALITLIGRTKNTGMTFNEDHTELLTMGEAPLLLEPINATITFPRKARILILDHQGRRTGKEIKPKGDTFHLLGSYETMYYEVCFD